jgi:hypothetical protein
MPDRTRHRIKMKICGGGPASHIDQGRHSPFTARVLQRPGARDYVRRRKYSRIEISLFNRIKNA